MEGGNAVWVSGHETLLLMGKSGAGGFVSLYLCILSLPYDTLCTSYVSVANRVIRRSTVLDA